MIDRGRIARAFSPSRTLDALVHPKSGHLAPLDGLRALAILWTIAFHTAWFSFGRMTRAHYLEFFDDPRFTLVWRGHFGVDVFFVLSGFLIAGILLDERERTGRLRLGLFYLRRLLRLWPTLLLAVLAMALANGRSPLHYWPSALYVSNFVPMFHGGMAHTWSLAIEEHFYLVCPWLIDAVTPLGTRGRQRVLIALVALSCVVAAGVAIAGNFHPIDTEVVANRGFLRWARGCDALYGKPWMRVGPLLAGVMAAVAHRDGRTMPALGRSGAIGVLLLVVALALAVVASDWPAFEGAARGLEVAYIAAHRAVFGLAIAYVLLFVVSEHSLGRALGRVLGARALHPIAQLAYAAYLFNPLVVAAVQRWLAPQTREMSEVGGYLLLLACQGALTFAVALVAHVAVERPLMELRPRAPAEAPAEAAPPPSRRRLATQIAVMLLLGVVLPLALRVLVPLVAPRRGEGRPEAPGAASASETRHVLSSGAG